MCSNSPKTLAPGSAPVFQQDGNHTEVMLGGVTTQGQHGENEEQPVATSGASFVLQGKHVLLGHLHGLVQERGGWSQCSKDNKWVEVTRALGIIPHSETRDSNGGTYPSILKEHYRELMAWMEKGVDGVDGDGERKLGPGETLLVTRKGVRAVTDLTLQTHGRWGDVLVPQTYYKDMIGSRAASDASASGLFHVFLCSGLSDSRRSIHSITLSPKP